MSAELNEIISGVGAFIVTSDVRPSFLSIEELRSKRTSNKLFGMRSLPMETCEVGETLDATLDRLFLEEVAPAQPLVRGPKLGRYELNPGVVLHAFLFPATQDIEFVVGTERSEIGPPKWLCVDDVLNQDKKTKFRPGVYEVVSDYLRYMNDPLRFSPGLYRYDQLRNRVPEEIFDLLEKGANQNEVLFQYYAL